MTYSAIKRQEGRDFGVDIAKALGIYCVVLAHTVLYVPLRSWIYTFHMPLFFFLSGYLFSYGRNALCLPFVSKRFRQLVVPYVWMNALTYLFWLFVKRKVEGCDADVELWSPFVAFLTVDADNMVHDIPLWFLFCLFIIETAYYVLFKNRGTVARMGLIVLSAALGYAVYACCPVRLPFSLGTAFIGLVFYALGNEVRRRNWDFRNILLAVCALVVTLIVCRYNGRINMHLNYYNNYILFFLGGAAGICAVLGLCRRMEKSLLKVRRIVCLISDNTLYICGFHLLFLSMLKGILKYLFHFDYSVINEGVAGNVLFAIAGMALCCLSIGAVKAAWGRLRGVCP